MSRAIALSTVVMTHPSRLRQAQALRDRHPELQMRIVADPVPEGERCTLRTAAAAWAAVPDDATHHLVVQDDAILCEGFAERLTSALATYPEEGLALFCEWGSDTSYLMRLAAVGGIPWVDVTDRYVPSVALVLPAAVGREFGELAAVNLDEWVRQDDVALRIFLLDRGVRVLSPLPNLVEHDPGPSLAGNDYMGPRRSACFISDVKPLPDNGSTAAIHPMAVPYYSWFTGEAFLVVRDDTHEFGWRTDPVEVALMNWGLDPEAVHARAEAEVARWRLDYPGMPIVPLIQLWLTALLQGVVLAGDPIRSVSPSGDPLPDRPTLATAAFADALEQPIAARTLATMSQGALRKFTDLGVLALLEQPLAQLMRGAILHGHELAK